jgi:hypothetical protein
MKKQKIAELDAFARKIGISDEEIAEWFYSLPTSLIKTDLPLVYKDGNNLTTKIGLVFEDMGKLWGIQILPRVVLSLASRDENDEPFGKDKAKKFAESIYLDGVEGSLPTLEVLKAFNDKKISKAFKNTIDVLIEYDIETVTSGVVWTANEWAGFNYLFGIGAYGEEVIRREREEFKSKVARFAVMF